MTDKERATLLAEYTETILTAREELLQVKTVGDLKNTVLADCNSFTNIYIQEGYDGKQPYEVYNAVLDIPQIYDSYCVTKMRADYKPTWQRIKLEEGNIAEEPWCYKKGRVVAWDSAINAGTDGEEEAICSLLELGRYITPAKMVANSLDPEEAERLSKKLEVQSEWISKFLSVMEYR